MTSKALDWLTDFCILYLATAGGWIYALRLDWLKAMTVGIIILASTLYVIHHRCSVLSKGWLLFLAGIAASALFASRAATPLITLCQFGSIYLALALASSCSRDRLVRLLRWLAVFYIGMAAIQLVSWLVTLTGPEFPPRLPSLLGNPNNFGIVLVFLILLALDEQQYLAVGVLAFFLFLTGSRASWFDAAISVTVYLLFSGKWRAMLQKWPFLAISGLLAVGIPLYIFYHPGITSTLSTRVTFWWVALLMFQWRPLAGWGPWSVIHFNARLMDHFPSREMIYTHSHSFPLNVLSESGLLGFVPLLLLLIVLGIRARESKWPMIKAIFTALILSNLLDYYLWVPATGIIMGMVWLVEDEKRSQISWLLSAASAILITSAWLLALRGSYCMVLY